jgi:hypothetical protein
MQLVVRSTQEEIKQVEEESIQEEEGAVLAEKMLGKTEEGQVHSFPRDPARPDMYLTRTTRAEKRKPLSITRCMEEGDW